MSESVISVRTLGKRYRIGASGPRYKTLRESLAYAFRPGRRVRDHAIGLKETGLLWALREVSFDVSTGEIVGVIGRNGAGKSTLLKILTRITAPTEGEVELCGRVGSLLEVGTGFHPELTGRENIYLNGAVLGMLRREVKAKFDQIIAFAEVERFIDTPVKHYSSGMYMRLAFAVAAHLEPEILLVDEVLAVGDSEFQKKCLGKMDEVARSGRTVLFVSHNLAAVQQLCTRGVVLEQGRLGFDGSVQAAIEYYMAANQGLSASSALDARSDRQGDGSLRFTRVHLCDDLGRPIEQILSGQYVRFVFQYEAQQALEEVRVNIAFNVYNSRGIVLTNLNSKDVGRMLMPIGRTGQFECCWPKFSLRAGQYTCTLFCAINGTIVDWIQSAFSFTVEDGDYFGTGSLIEPSQGEVLVDYEWSYQLGEQA
jgi:lipopolysaccharide transport system ATP-binding protein